MHRSINTAIIPFTTLNQLHTILLGRRISLVVILFSFTSFYTANSQKLLTALTVPGKISNLRGMTIDDNIFLSIELPEVNTKPTIISYFIHPDGTASVIDLKAIGHNPIIAGIRRGENTLFYYLDRESKVPVIKMVLIDSSATAKALPEILELPAKYMGLMLTRVSSSFYVPSKKNLH